MFSMFKGNHAEKLNEIKASLKKTQAEIAHARDLVAKSTQFSTTPTTPEGALVFGTFPSVSLLNCHRVSIALIQATADTTMPAHKHTQHEILVQLIGTTTIVLNGIVDPPAIVHMSEGDYICIKPGQTHAAEYHTTGVQLAVVIPGAKEFPGYPEACEDGCGRCEECACVKLFDAIPNLKG